MAAAARDENEVLKARIAALEARMPDLPRAPRSAEPASPQGSTGGVKLTEEEIQDERDDGAPIEVLEQYFEARAGRASGPATARSSLRRPAAGRSMSCAAYGVLRTRCCSSSLFPTSRSGPRSARDLRGAGADQRAIVARPFRAVVGLRPDRVSPFDDLDSREGDGLSFEQAEAIAEAAMEECERFYPGVPVRPVGRQVAGRGDLPRR